MPGDTAIPTPANARDRIDEEQALVLDTLAASRTSAPPRPQEKKTPEPRPGASARVLYLDTETTGLDPDRHDVWEIAAITATGDEHTWTLTPDLSGADPQALAINRYYQRTAHLGHPGETVLHPTTGDRLPTFHRPARAALQLARLLDGATVIGSNPAFDQAFLTRWLRRNGQCWTAHYRTIDVITLAWGHLTATTRTPLAWPPSTTEVCAAAGIDLTAYDRHTALGDARWVRDLHTTLTKEAQ